MPIEGFEAIAGKWTLVKNEGFDEYLSAMGEYLVSYGCVSCQLWVRILSAMGAYLVSYG